MDKNNTNATPVIDFGAPQDMMKNIIKVIGVGGAGCNAVNNMYHEGIVNVSFAVCNTDSQSLAKSPVPVKLLLGRSGLGAGANPDVGREEAQQNIEDIKHLLDDGTKMVFVTAGMGGGTGTGAGPVVAGIAKQRGILTVGIVTIPYYFEKKKKIIKALKGVEEMRHNVDALLIINNERLCDVYSDSHITVKESFKRADDILKNATKSISELITVEGDVNLDFRDVETTMRGGGGAIMAMGRASGEHRVERAIMDTLNSPLLYGSDISKAKKILFNIYTGDAAPLCVDEMNEIDAFMDSLDPNIDVIWGVSDDNTLGEDAKVTILATGLDDDFNQLHPAAQYRDDEYYEDMIDKLYLLNRRKKGEHEEQLKQPEFKVEMGNEDGEVTEVKVEEEPKQEADPNAASAESVIPTDSKDAKPDEEQPTEEASQEPAQPQRPLTFMERMKKRMAALANEMMSDMEHE